MPTTRRRRRWHPAPSNFEAVGLRERLDWGLGSIRIEGEIVRARYAQGSPLPCWPSWEAWASCYARCREDFLRHYAIRHTDETPGAELRFAAYQRGEDPGAVVIDRGPDPRRVLAAT